MNAQQNGEATSVTSLTEHVSHLSPLGQQAALATDYWHRLRQAYADVPEVADALCIYCEDYAQGR